MGGPTPACDAHDTPLLPRASCRARLRRDAQRIKGSRNTYGSSCLVGTAIGLSPMPPRRPQHGFAPFQARGGLRTSAFAARRDRPSMGRGSAAASRRCHGRRDISASMPVRRPCRTPHSAVAHCAKCFTLLMLYAQVHVPASLCPRCADRRQMKRDIDEPGFLKLQRDLDGLALFQASWRPWNIR
jgi:hypothetical protein